MLRAVEAGGPEGVRARDFCKRYFGDGTPAHVKCSGRLLHYCHGLGYVMRVGWRGDALHQLTDQGRSFLAGFWKRARQEVPAIAEGHPTAAASTGTTGTYGRVGGDVVSTQLAYPVTPGVQAPARAGGYGRVS